MSVCLLHIAFREIVDAFALAVAPDHGRTESDSIRRTGNTGGAEVSYSRGGRLQDQRILARAWIPGR